MVDDPSFPSPDAAKRTDVRITPSEPKNAIVVQRPEPIPESLDATNAANASNASKGGAPKLSPEEVRALLAVNEVNRPKQTTWRRGRKIALPMIVLSAVSHFATAYWPIIVGLLVVGALVWVFGPWKPKQDEWGG